MGQERQALGEESEQLESCWAQICARAERLVQESGRREIQPRFLENWKRRLRPLCFRGNVFTISVRSEAVLRFVQLRLLPRLSAAARQILGESVRVVIETDRSLRSTLHSLGFVPRRKESDGSFIECPEVTLAHGAVMSMARDDQPGWRLLFLQGPAGCGKSRLLRMFRKARSERCPGERWCHRRAADWAFEFASVAREHGARGELVRAWSDFDGLILDDMHHLSGKWRTQELLVSILNSYRTHDRLVLLAGQRIERPQSRFVPSLWTSLVGDYSLVIPELSGASRSRILRQRFSFAGLPEEWFDRLGAVHRLPLEECSARLGLILKCRQETGEPLDPRELERRFPDLGRAARGEVMDRLLDRCAQFAGVSREAILSGSRTRHALLGRHLIIYLGLEVFALQRSTMRSWLGTLSDSTIPYVRSKIRSLSDGDPRVRGFIREIAEEIQHGQRFLFDRP